MCYLGHTTCELLRPRRGGGSEYNTARPGGGEVGNASSGLFRGVIRHGLYTSVSRWAPPPPLLLRQRAPFSGRAPQHIAARYYESRCGIRRARAGGGGSLLTRQITQRIAPARGSVKSAREEGLRVYVHV